MTEDTNSSATKPVASANNAGVVAVIMSGVLLGAISVGRHGFFWGMLQGMAIALTLMGAAMFGARLAGRRPGSWWLPSRDDKPGWLPSRDDHDDTRDSRDE